MMFKVTSFLLLLALYFTSAQEQENDEVLAWEVGPTDSVNTDGSDPSVFQVVQVDVQAISNEVKRQLQGQSEASVVGELYSSSLRFPLPDVGSVTCLFSLSSIMPRALQDKFPALTEATGSCTAGVRASLILLDEEKEDVKLSGTFYLPDRKTLYLDAIKTSDSHEYALSDKIYDNNENPTKEDLEDIVLNTEVDFNPSFSCGLEPSTTQLVQFSIAIAANVPFSNRNIFPSTTRPRETVLFAIVSLLARINGIFRNELGVAFQLIENSENIICAAEDTESNELPVGCNDLPNSSGDTIDDFGVVGNFMSGNGVDISEYNLGHLLGTASGGVAAKLGMLCDTNRAEAFTGTSPSRMVSVFAHELGHQLLGSHTFRDCTRLFSLDLEAQFSEDAAVEPGSGSTILSYAGICLGDDVQGTRDMYFNGVNLVPMKEYVLDEAICKACGTTIDTGLQRPVVSAFGDTCTIPVGSKAFALTGTNRSAPSTSARWAYSWERVDTSSVLGEEEYQDDNVGRFRSWSPSTSLTRVMPNLHTLRYPSVNDELWERIPTSTKEMTFRFIARTQYDIDETITNPEMNLNMIGDFDYDDATVMFDDSVDPLLIDMGCFERGVVCPDSTINLNWDVGGTATLSPNVVIEIAINRFNAFDYDPESDPNLINWYSLGTYENVGNARVLLDSTRLGASEGTELFLRIRSDSYTCSFFDFVHFTLDSSACSGSISCGFFTPQDPAHSWSHDPCSEELAPYPLDGEMLHINKNCFNEANLLDVNFWYHIQVRTFELLLLHTQCIYSISFYCCIL